MANDIKLANEQTKSHWETVQQWRIDEGKNFARSRSNQISRMAAGGMKAGSDQWNANLASVDAANAAEKKSQKNSATYGLLDKWTKDMKKFYVDASTSYSRTYQTKGDDRTTNYFSREGNALRKSGEANVYTDSGLSKAEWNALSTEEFMNLQFGTTKKYDTFTDKDGSTAAAAAQESQRQNAARAQTQRASPWWA